MAGPTRHHRHSKAPRRWLLPAAIVAVVVVVAAVVVLVTASRHDDGPAPAATPLPAPTVTVAPPLPTPTVTPSPRATTTAFTAALPASVLQYAYASSQPEAEWLSAGALEAWADAYVDGGAGTLTVQAGQFRTAGAATAFAATLVAALPPALPAPGEGQGRPAFPQAGDVTVAGATVGTYTVTDGGLGDSGVAIGIAVWTNGTAVFRMVAPLVDIANAYAAYPL